MFPTPPPPPFPLPGLGGRRFENDRSPAAAGLALPSTSGGELARLPGDKAQAEPELVRRGAGFIVGFISTDFDSWFLSSFW